MYYIDTSVLMPYTLTKKTEPKRYQKVEQLFELAEAGKIKLATSLYVFSELYAIALESAPDILSASDVAKEAIQSILQTKIILLPFPSRIQRSIFSRRLAELRDTSDLSHAISAIVNNCEAIISYDRHFQQIEHIIPCWVPEQVIDMILDLLNQGDSLNWL